MDKELIWINEGYRTFANEGPTGLKIERMAKAVQKNKSSFYHYFASLEVFTQRLLEQHLKVVHEIARKEAKARTEQELIVIFLDHKTDFLFNRQLRVYREVKGFEECILKTNDIAIPAILPIWQTIIGLDQHHYLAQVVFMLSLENFFLQITDETLSEPWLVDYFKTIRQMVNGFKQTGNGLKLNGTD